MLELQHDGATPLTSQIVDGVRALVADRVLRPGAKMPSIRAFANQLSVSVFTVVEAYDRLVARGVLESRASAGFFVQRQVPAEDAAPRKAPRFDAAWYLKQIFENIDMPIKPGCGWLPQDWMFEDGVRRALRQLAGDGFCRVTAIRWAWWSCAACWSRAWPKSS